MADGDRNRWDERHAAHEGAPAPSNFLVEILERGPWRIQTGRALDIATGKGRNALYLAQKGFTVEAVDLSDAALREARIQASKGGLSIDFRKQDLEKAELAEALYDLIINFNFLERALIPKIKKSLKLGAHVIFETYLIDQRVLGHPRNPAYLLGHNELLELFRDLRILYYREGKFAEGGKEAYRAGLLAQKVR